MVVIENHIDIEAPAPAVFDLVVDVDRMYRLDPGSVVLGVGKVTPGPVAVGTEFAYRLVIGGRYAEYRSRCVAFESGRRMETVSDTSPPFSVRVTAEPIPGGTRLGQRESFRLVPLRMPVPRAGGLVGRVLRLVFGRADALVQSADSLLAEEAQLVRELTPKMQRWHRAIKRELEKGDRIAA